jgi:hypothetical protein
MYSGEPGEVTEARQLVMFDKARSEMLELEDDASGVMFWIVTWTLGIVDEEVKWLAKRGFLVEPRSKLRQ